MATTEGAIMNKLAADLAADLPRLLLPLVLLPLVLLWVPLMYAMAWVHEAFEDLRAPRLRPAPALLARRDPPFFARPRYRR